MHQKDKIKALVALTLIIIVLGTFFIVGKEAILMKYVSGAALIIWLTTMFWLNKKS